ncbi:probable bifunctional methylthioribulose-1-phosphate dehydratase/enolase-phosphatase E1 isoform X1 [Abrus precatorius]|uniref:Probable bifunctional methylthioribulose-1-phosphate dehydratase/enolase-phosphatase E1 n=1 Tax=Abrus precatorius TaxID=3816 RepID=A0A8B8K9M2_ABRPR|nr:probable bifunctional methylthioribulose-1-phosphate dehydratase/enolase-phosphatase E1 isoform X1 [Abrus precatorius]XP_027340473.1 probable bifunctional methylthioribulose-1-phosphate dehydratase/enolase-phosphatase E1 isoform X1 [Abrus precatorius]XP_027340474.1 probable bifunctional methylthioribulose-1-phosphate dehydratase/enolase-phosphatase E1 isoform X1 [Abrus precatorius]
MAAIGLNGVKVGTTSSQAYLESKAVKETRALMAELCRHFYNLGWVTGTGGSITMKVHDDSIPKPQQLILMSPSGVQKERMEPEDMYVLSNSGLVLSAPSPKPYPHKPPKCTDCDPLFRKAYEMRDAVAVFHSHGIESCLVTMINPLSKEFRITHMEMIKGIKGHGYYDELVVPIIENTAYEYQLTESFAKAIEDYPKATAVLVRNHGVFVWGDSWISAKTQSECYHYLFDAAIKLHQMGLDWSTPNHGPIQSARRGLLSIVGQSNVSVKARKANGEIDPFPHCIVLDIEGTTTPISFVSEVLFPYARDNVGRHLSATYDTPETKADIKLLRSQVESDLAQGIAGAVPIPPDDAGKEEVIAALVVNVNAMIKADRKITALKELQGHIWRTGYENNELEGIVFDDVPEALEKWHALGLKVYIYSSGSRLAQRLIFGKTNYGDLRKYLSGFFDTTVGNKRETRSYVEISESLGVDKPSDILFVTDVYQEATAAKAAGLEAIISIRPGNGPLPENHGFKTIKSFLEI